MENIGWEIRPEGWILLFIVLGLLAYYLFSLPIRMSHVPNLDYFRFADKPDGSRSTLLHQGRSALADFLERHFKATKLLRA